MFSREDDAPGIFSHVLSLVRSSWRPLVPSPTKMMFLAFVDMSHCKKDRHRGIALSDALPWLVFYKTCCPSPLQCKYFAKECVCIAESNPKSMNLAPSSPLSFMISTCFHLQTWNISCTFNWPSSLRSPDLLPAREPQPINEPTSCYSISN